MPIPGQPPDFLVRGFKFDTLRLCVAQIIADFYALLHC